MRFIPLAHLRTVLTARHRRQGLQIAALILAACISPLSLEGQTSSVSEPQAKAGFLLNFARFTEWPTSALGPADPIVICATDADVARELEKTIGGRKVGEHPVRATHIDINEPDRACAIVYAHRLDQQKTEELLVALGTAPVLTVSDSKGFARFGGGIQLFLTGGRMAFGVNRTAAERSGLRLSSKLLGLSKPVED